MNLPLNHWGGGGHNSLKEKENDDNPQSDDDTGDSGESQVTTYTYKSYYEYFIDTMDCTGVYDTDNNLTNVTISAEKKAEILLYDFTGSGTANDPYQINTTQGFWYMSNFVNFTNKNVELNCDVVLNDEKFDENGNASGGDGVVYVWKPITTGTGATFLGNDKIISGLYFNDVSQNGIALFKSNLSSVKDLKISSAFLQGGQYVGTMNIRGTTTNYYNCHTKNCYILGGKIFGLAANGNFENCSNSATLFSNEDAGGIVEAGTLFNCTNYGDIYIENSGTTKDTYYFVGGVAASHSNVYNCKNYGTIKLTGESTKKPTGLGGIVGCNSREIKNCENYGNLINTNLSGGNCGGIAGYCYRKDATIKNCTNYADVYCGNGISGTGHFAQIVSCNNYGDVTNGCAISGAMNQSDFIKDTFLVKDCHMHGNIILEVAHSHFGIFVAGTCAAQTLEIIDCSFTGKIFGKTSSYYGYFGYMGKKTFEQYYICNNVKIDAEFTDTNSVINIFGTYYCYKFMTFQFTNCEIRLSGDIKVVRGTGFIDEGFVEVNNCVYNINSTNSKFSFSFTEQETPNLTIKNAMIDIVCLNSTKNFANEKYFSIINDEANLDGILMTIKTTTQITKKYYGNNFGRYKVIWKTGEIVNTALYPVGLYGDKIDEMYLNSIGYVKIR